MKKVRFSMPTRWRNFLTILTDWPDRLPVRLIYKIERYNKRLAMFEAQEW